MSFSEYLQRRRISTAMELLKRGMTVESVMEQVGYRDRKSFYRYFKKIAGATPAEFRRSSQIISSEETK